MGQKMLNVKNTYLNRAVNMKKDPLLTIADPFWLLQ